MPTATPFNNLITFSRGSNATVVGPNGLIQWAPNNLLTNSEQFDNAAWTKTNATVTANTTATTDPVGGNTADLITENLATSEHRVINATAVPTVSGLSYVATVYAKRATGSRNLVLYQLAGTTGWAVYVDLSNGDVVSSVSIGGGAGSASVTSIGNGWYRAAVTFTTNTTSTLVSVGMASGTTADYTGNGTSGIYLWGAQLELGSTATTYNPTTVKNLLGFSEAFDNAAWTKSNSSIVTGAQANPVNGLFNAQKLMENTAAGNHRVAQGFTSLTGATYTFSCYAKAAERTWIYLYDDMANGYAFFNLANGTVGTVAAGWTSTSITSVGNGWYRISGTTTEAAGGVGGQLIGIASANNTPSYTGDGNSGVYIYGAQLSDSASLDPYVPTPGAAPSSTAFYGPRFDFDPVTLQPRGLLVEEQRTNLFTYSEQFDNADWGKSNTTVTANTAVAPDGRTTADTITSTSTSSELSRAVTVGTVQHTFSIYLKHNNNQWVVLYGERGFVWFDVLNGVVGTQQANVSGAITAVGNGWYRCAVTSTSLDTSYAAALAMASGDNSTTEVNGGAVFAWGAQLEAGAFATSYIPTVASQVTRTADVVNVTGANFSSWYAANGGTFVVDYTLVGSTVTSYPFGLSNNATLTAFYGPTAASGTGAASAYANFNSSAGAFDVSGIAGSTPLKLAVALAANDRAISKNAAAVASSAAAWAVPAVARLDIGDLGGTGAYRVGSMHIRSINFIPARAADFQLQALTAQTVVDYFFLQTATGDQLVDGNGDDLYSLPIFG